jgi:hypothetical protein
MMTVNDELEMMRKEASCFKVLFCHLAERAEGKHENLCQNSWSADKDLKPRPPKYKASLPSFQPQHNI